MGTKTIKVAAFGETREIEVTTSEGQPGRYWLPAVFVAKFRTGTKLHKVDVDLHDGISKVNSDGAFIVNSCWVTTLNRNKACIIGWWDEAKHGKNKSQHVGSH